MPELRLELTAQNVMLSVKTILEQPLYRLSYFSKTEKWEIDQFINIFFALKLLFALKIDGVEFKMRKKIFKRHLV